MTDRSTYHAFISYSHKENGRLAVTLQDALQSFGTRLWESRDVRVFLDIANIALTDDILKKEILPAVRASSYFLLLASPESAKSWWVHQEIDAFADKERIGVVLTSGKTPWTDGKSFDSNAPDAAVSETVIDLFKLNNKQPFVVDLRPYRTSSGDLRLNDDGWGAIASIKAKLLGVSKDVIWGRHLDRMRKRVATFASLFVAAIVASCLALLLWRTSVTATLTARTQLLESRFSQSASMRGTLAPDRRLNAERLIDQIVPLIDGSPNPQSSVLRARTELASVIDLPGLDSVHEQFRPTKGQLAAAVPIPPLERGELSPPTRIGFGVPTDDWYRGMQWYLAAASFDADERVLVMPASGRPILIHDDGTVEVRKGDSETYRSVAISSSARWCIQIASDDSLTLLDAQGRSTRRPLLDKQGKRLLGFQMAAFNAKNDRFAVVSTTGPVDAMTQFSQVRCVVFSTLEATCLSDWTTPMIPPNSVAVSPRGDVIAIGISPVAMPYRYLVTCRANDGVIMNAGVVEVGSMDGLAIHRNRLDFSRDGLLLVASGDSLAKVFKFPSFELGGVAGRVGVQGTLPTELFMLTGHRGSLSSLAGSVACSFSPDGRWLATVGGNSEFRIWDMVDGRLVTNSVLFSNQRQGFSVNDLRWSDTGRKLLCLSSAGLFVWRFTPPWSRSYQSLSGRGAPVRNLQISPNYRWLATGDEIIDLETGRRLALGNSGVSGRGTFGLDGVSYCTGGFGNKMLGYTLPCAVATEEYGSLLTNYYDVACDDRGHYILAGTSDNSRLALYDPKSPQPRWVQTRRGFMSNGYVECSQDGERLMTLAVQDEPGRQADQLLKCTILQSQNGKVERVTELPSSGYDLAKCFFRQDEPMVLLHPDNLFHVGVESSTLYTPLREVPIHGLISPLPSTAVGAFSSDGKYVVRLEADGESLVVRELATGNQVWALMRREVLSAPTEALLDVAFSPTGDSLCVLSGLGISVWKIGGIARTSRLECSAVAFRVLDADRVVFVDRMCSVWKWEIGKVAEEICNLGEATGLRVSNPRALLSRTGRFLAVYTPPGDEILAPVAQPRFEIKVWELSQSVTKPIRIPIRGQFRNWSFDSSDRLALLTTHQSLCVYDVNERREMLSLECDEGEAFGARLSARARQVVIPRGTSGDESLEVRNISGGRAATTIPVKGRLVGFAIAETSPRVVINSGGHLQIWENGIVGDIAAPRGRKFSGCAISADGSCLAAILDNGEIQIRNGLSGKIELRFRSGLSAIEQCTVSEGGRLLAAADTIGNVRVWDLDILRNRLQKVGLHAGSRSRRFTEISPVHAARVAAWQADDDGVAIDILSDAMNKHPTSAILTWDRAVHHQQRNNFADAISDLRRVRTLDPDMLVEDMLAELVELEGQRAIQNGDFHAAFSSFRESLNIRRLGGSIIDESKYISCFTMFAKAAIGADRKGDAIEACSVIARQYQGWAELERILATCVALPDCIGDWRPVAERLRIATAASTQTPIHDYVLGAAFIRAGEVSTGIDVLERVDQARRSPMAELFLAMGYSDLGMHEAALRQLMLARERQSQASSGGREDPVFEMVYREAEDNVCASTAVKGSPFAMR